MCASVYSSLLLFTLTTISIQAFGAKMATEGLPLVRQERGADRGILAGADFLSVFMSSSLRHAYREPPSEPEMTTKPEVTTEPEVTTTEPEETTTVAHTRATRSTQTEDSLTTLSAQSSDSSSETVVAVRVSSSVGRTLIHKNPATEYPDQSPVASEEHPSLVAEAKKSEFSVEESEPITTNSDLADFFQEYPASVQPIPRPFSLDKQQTVIYHGPRENGRARSVSYSTVIQAVPEPKAWDEGKRIAAAPEPKRWDEEKSPKPWDEEKRRRERHFDGQTAYANDLKNDTKPKGDWQPSTPRTFTTERNWEMHEKHYARFPTVYGKPEQNYEVDESASVMTNGRVHGVQATPTLPSKQEVKESKKADDNQKVGYVVEGRNYRKYRVEEKTPDGFIVGEYGVVSHDDGSLRGVRYTADGTISPKLIYDALMKFLSL